MSFTIVRPSMNVIVLDFVEDEIIQIYCLHLNIIFHDLVLPFQDFISVSESPSRKCYKGACRKLPEDTH